MDNLYCPHSGENQLLISDSLSIETLSSEEKALYYYYQGRLTQKFSSEEEFALYLKDMLKGKLLSLQNYFPNLDKTVEYYRNALVQINISLGESSSADKIAIKAEIMSHYSLLDNFRQMIDIGLKVEPTANEALQLDSENTRALMVLASAKVFAPRLYGGNPEKGIEILSSLVKKFELTMTKEQQFNAYTGIAFSYIRQNKKNKANKWLRKADEVYPDSLLISVLDNWE